MAEQKAITLTPRAALITLGLLVLGGLLLYYKALKAGSLVPLPLPNNGSGIPDGWSPTGDVVKLRNAMDGFGTNEEGIFDTLTGKTSDQLIAIKNEYGHRYNEDLIEAFNSELSGDDLQRALEFYKGLV